MHLKFASWSLFLYLLALKMNGLYANGGAVPKTSMQNVEEIDHHVRGGVSHVHMHSSSHHMDQQAIVFFTLNELKVGSVLPVFFRGTNPTNAPKFLPREEADQIPFSPSKLTFLLQHFGFARGSSQAKAMENTLRECVVPPIKGETKFCATSLESMLEFVHEMIGLTTNVQVLNTKRSANLANVLRNYTILDEPREVSAPKLVACHTMPYPYVIYYCHYQKSESKVFQVSLQGENKGENYVEAIAVCHMDTSQWSRNHVSFQVLGIEPGTSPVCHFFPEDNLVWVPLSSANEGYQNKIAQI